MRSWNNDPYTKKAQRENYSARSVYKLQEILSEKDLKPARTILDLGAAPGSWSEWCLKASSAQIFAIDLQPISLANPRFHFLQGDIQTLNIPAFLGGKKVDLLLSDMAPKTSGVVFTDVCRSIELCEMALSLAPSVLREGGDCVLKIFMGEGMEDFVKKFKENFQSFKMLRPKATRKASKEIFLIGRRFKGLSLAAAEQRLPQ